MSLETAQESAQAQATGDSGSHPVQTRNERFVSTDVTAFPTVTGRESAWKFTPVEKLSDLLDGELDGSQPPMSIETTSGVTTKWTARSSANIGRAGLPEDRASANSWGQTVDVQEIHITGEGQSATILRNALGSSPRAAHTVIESAPHSSGMVVLDNTGGAKLSENVEIVLGDASKLTVVSVQRWDDDAVHLASHFARIGRDAELKHIVVSFGGNVVRVNPSFHLSAQGGSVDALGAYFSSQGEHLEQQVYVDHDAPHTKSRVTYKGALHGQGSRTVWIGDVLIRQTATGTDSYEQNRNLVLSDGTRADSIPNLEIETGDIAGAGHASASGRFDDEQLFYLMSRGVTEEEARRLVVRGFLLEVIQQIGDEKLEAELNDAIEAELAREKAEEL